MAMRLKVCCIASPAEARLAVAAGAHALGLVGPMPTGPGVLAEDAIAPIAAGVPPGVSRFWLTARTDPAEIARLAPLLGVEVVQCVRSLAPADHRRLAEAVPWLRRVQVIHVEDARALDEAAVYAPVADALLLDSGRPSADEFGGTGRRHDWSVSAEIVRRSSVPVWLAGGLTPDNVAEAVAQVRPFGVDVCSGLRTDGALDAGKLAAFVAALGRTSAQEASAASVHPER